MKTRLMMVVILSALLLAACGAPAAVPGVPAQPPSVLPTQPPSVLPTQPPSPLSDAQPGSGLVTRPEAEAWENAPVAAVKARADLANHLQVDPDTIKLVSVDQAEWPDGCLGVQTPGVMCTMVITPGYSVILEADGKQYEYHTDASGDVVRLANVKLKTGM
jgi:hypothetical protein